MEADLQQAARRNDMFFVFLFGGRCRFCCFISSRAIRFILPFLALRMRTYTFRTINRHGRVYVCVITTVSASYGKTTH
jgi:hypothetical protein